MALLRMRGDELHGQAAQFLRQAVEVYADADRELSQALHTGNRQ